MAQPSDQASGRRERFDALFSEHCADVRGYALRRASPSSAQDVVAETFAVAWRRLDEVPEDPLPWLLGVARRVLANPFRSEARRAALLDRLRQTASIHRQDGQAT